MSKIQRFFTENGFSGLINQTACLMRMKFSAIKDKYANFPICLIEYHENSTEKLEIEIRFDHMRTTLSCSFDSAKRCNRIFMYLDAPEDNLGKYISFLNEVYKYDHAGFRWILANCYLILRKGDKRVCFLFMC